MDVKRKSLHYYITIVDCVITPPFHSTEKFPVSLTSPQHCVTKKANHRTYCVRSYDIIFFSKLKFSKLDDFILGVK